MTTETQISSMSLKELATLRDKFIDERAELNKQVSRLTEQINELDTEIIRKMQDVGDAAVINGRRYAPETVVVPKVESWDDLYTWMLENKAPYLLQRRVSSTAYRDLLDSGMGPDGIVPETIVRLSVRKV